MIVSWIFCILWCVVTALWVTKALSGTLRIDQTNPDKDVFRLEIDDLNALPKKKYILLKVDTKSNLSQK